LWPDGVQFAAAGAMIGHLYPVWLKFQGGKGVATLMGVIAPLLWWQGPAVYALVWLGLLLVVRISSVAGMVAAATPPLVAALLNKDELFPLLLTFALLVIWKHRANIQRLFAGTEPRIGTSRGND
jgi:glycerol-3-phosphate acyltransferase PlsY